MSKKHLNLPASNLEALQKNFAGIILDSREGDGSGQPSSYLCVRHTFVFKDGSRLLIKEFLTKNGFIEAYFYDWADANGNVLLKFHADPHKNPKYQTETEPFHVHPPDDAKLTNRTRYPNYDHRDLHSILELIALFLIANRKI